MKADWSVYFWPQICAPWGIVKGIFNIPWLFVLLQPIRPLGSQAVLTILQVMSLLSVIMIGKRLRLSAWRMVMVIFSPPIIQCFIMGQFDGIFLSAYMLHPVSAVFLALAKPQVALCAGIVAGLRSKWAAFFGMGLIISAYLIWGWPIACLGTAGEFLASTGIWSNTWNWSPWPWGLLLIPLLKTMRGRLLLSPFLFPYAAIQSFIGPLLTIATLPAAIFILTWAGMWIRWAYMMEML